MSDYIVLLLLVTMILISIFILFKFGKIQKVNIIEWLLFAVTKAEKQLGSGTGQIKLRLVYDWFIMKYPIISKLIPFKVFSVWVDIALKELQKLLTNSKIAGYVEGDT